MSRKYKFRNPEAAYFVSFATCYWIDVFTRQCYFGNVPNLLVACFLKRNVLEIKFLH